MKTEKYFKYKNLEDCLLHASDKMNDFAKQVEALDEWSMYKEEMAVGIYASCLLFVNGWNEDLRQKIKEERARSLASNFGGLYTSCLYPTTILPPKAEYEDILWANELMHILHVNNPKLREEAIKFSVDIIDSIKYKFESDYQTEFYFPNYDKHITGKSAFPEEIKSEVEKIVKNYADLAVEYHVTWYFSHYDCGLDYMYTEDETPYLKIKSLNRDSIDGCIESLSKLKWAEPLSLEEKTKEKESIYSDKIYTITKKANIPWVCAEGFLSKDNDKQELIEILKDINFFEDKILKKYNDYVIDELSGDESRRNEVFRLILGDEMANKYNFGNKSNEDLKPFDTLVKHTIDNYNNDLLENLSNVDTKVKLGKIIDKVNNYNLLSEDSLSNLYNKAIEVDDKESYRKIYNSYTGLYINNSSLNYIFKEKLSLDTSQIFELGKTFSEINNSRYDENEKQILKKLSKDLLEMPNVNQSTEFNNSGEKYLREAIVNHMDINKVNDMVNEMIEKPNDLEKIYKEKNRKYTISVEY